MGILGLTPFLQKAFPEVVKQFPDRLRGFAGKKVVIDGTLITQRLHFAQVPHHYRHVLGWYNVVKELQDAGVSAICVFDGKERSAAKAREAERRREAKELALARGAIELDRVKRLQRLMDVVGCFRELDTSQKERVSELLWQISSETRLPPSLMKLAPGGEAANASKVLDTEELPLSGDTADALKGLDVEEISIPDSIQPQEVSVEPDSVHVFPLSAIPSSTQEELPSASIESLEHDTQVSIDAPSQRKKSSRKVKPVQGASKIPVAPSSNDLPVQPTSSPSPLRTAPPPASQSSELPAEIVEERETPVPQPSSPLPVSAPESTHTPAPSSTPAPTPPRRLSVASAPAPTPAPASPLLPSSLPALSMPSADENSELVAPIPPRAPSPSSRAADDEPIPPTPSVSTTLSPLEKPFPVLPEPSAAEVSVASKVDVSAALTTLYLNFRESVHKLASLAPIIANTPQNTEADQREARVEYSMTKGQVQLTADEAQLWQDLAVFSSDEPPEVDKKLAELSLRANVMSQSYERRNNPPTNQTYDESKELLRSMGVPCIDTTGTYEAEALASSIVIQGFADYVVSEDTDVVAYDAPLLRNISNRSSPIMMLSGLEIRTALELDRSSFIDFALLLGTDFSQRIKNVGPVRALKFIRQHGSIERVIESETKYPPRVAPPAYLAEVELARLVFRTLPPIPDEKQLEQGKDEQELSVILQRFGLGRLLMGNEDFGYEDALQGNYFSDDPSAY
ncbi:flap endonuclease 1 [Favolaschia claudopus]|uniref:Flap endonuclease 1 n=1 Tax=Favolaschia claudopus TaxID=2862362 RepID=A0AAW0CKL8_9AGAR